MEELVCESTVIHQDVVEQVKKEMLEDSTIFDMAELYKVFGDSTRMKIICALLKSELCVCDIAAITSTTVSAISHQLRILKNAKLVKFRKVGKVVYYEIADSHVSEIFKKGLEHIEEI